MTRWRMIRSALDSCSPLRSTLPRYFGSGCAPVGTWPAVAARDSKILGLPGSKVPRLPVALLTCSGRNVTEWRSEEHTSELQSLMRISYDVLCLKQKIRKYHSSHRN